jgi:hypothetical protein
VLRRLGLGAALGQKRRAMPLLVQFGALGALREGLVDAATQRFAPAALVGGVAVPISLGAAVVVFVAWIAVPLAAGAWRTCSRDA